MDRNEQLQEFAKCLADPVYAIETYLETFDQTQSGYVPFHLFPKQKELVHSIFENRFTIVTKPRQAGITTTTAACMAVKVSFYGDEDIPDKILILANRQEIAQEFLKKIKEFLEQVPRWVWGIEYVEDQKKSIFLTDSKKHIILPTKCEIKALATSKDALRGFTPTILVMDEAAYIDNGAEVYGAALPSLGCLDEKTLIITEDGLKPLGKLIKDKETQGFHDLDKPFKVVNRYGELENVTKTFTSSFDKTFTIRTKRGLELTGSWKHPVLIDKSNKDEWVRMYELNVGDKVMFNYNQNKFGNDNKLDFSYNGRKGSKVLNLPNDLTDHLDLCYLFGLFISEGNYNNGGIQITNGDEDIRNFLTNDLKKYGIIFKEYRKYKFQFISQEFRTFLKYLGLEQLTAPFKKFPDRFLTLSKPLITAILQGMFDGDGCSTNKEIKYSSTSKELINTLQVLLLNYGINSNVRESCSKPSKNSVCSNKDKVTCIYDLFIYSSDAIKFYNEIGFRLKRKQKNLSSLKNVSGSPKRSFEYDKDKIRKITKDNNFKSRSYRYLERFLLTDNKNISFYSANRLLSNCTVVTDEVVELENHLEKLNHYFEDEIVDIEEFYGNTYDLHLPETNSFISNGFISHNTGGKSVLISTPNGYDDLYYKIYDGAVNKRNKYNVVEMRWYQDLRYNKNLRWYKGDHVINEELFTLESYREKIENGYKPTSDWYESMCAEYNGDTRKIAQELDVSFLGSGGNVIDEEYVENQNKYNVITPIRTEGFDNNVWVWKDPEMGHQYILAGDVSRGDSEDFSTIQIIDFDSREQVLEYQGKIPPDILAELIYHYGEKYKAYTVIDITGGMGVTTVLKLVEMEYKRLHYDDPKSKVLSTRKDLGKYKKYDNKVPGFNVGANRLNMVAEFERCVRQNELIVRSSRLVSEMKTFVYRNGRPDHMDGYHDDLLMATAMCLWVLQTSFKNLEKVNEQTKAILNSWVSTSTVNNNIKTNTTINPNQPTPPPNLPNSDFMWLLGGMK